MRILRGSNDDQQNESMDLKYDSMEGRFASGFAYFTLPDADIDASHHGLTLLCGDKLYMAPLEKEKMQVRRQTYSSSP